MFEHFSDEKKKQIRNVVNNGGIVDVNGNISENDIELIDEIYHYSLSNYMHYRLLKGKSEAYCIDLLERSNKIGIEINLIMKKAKAFITEVLEIDLDMYTKNVCSEKTLMTDKLTELLAEAKEKYTDYINSNIVYDGHTYQADQKSQDVMLEYITTDTSPDYWLDVSNVKVKHDITTLNELYASILNRKKVAFEKFVSIKESLRDAYNTEKWDILLNFDIKF